MTMFQNWSTKDEIETSIRTFQRVRDEIENTFCKIEWRDDENGRENLYHHMDMTDRWADKQITEKKKRKP